MFWKSSIYLLFIALPAWLITSGTVENRVTNTSYEGTKTPVLKTKELVKTDAAILGSVIAPDAKVTICAFNGAESIKGTTNEMGEFFIHGFTEGTYDISIFVEKNNTIQTSEFKNVNTYIGEATALGTINLDE